MGKALEGIFVLAIEQAVAAPLCTVRLADAGARVVKIEREGGDMARHYDRSVQGTSAYFAWLNRGKQSIVLDLKSPADMELVETMLHSADVFVQNLAPGAAARLGLGLSSAQLVRRHPHLVALDIVGYGQDTPYRAMRAYDLLVQAESGICAVTGVLLRPELATDARFADNPARVANRSALDVLIVAVFSRHTRSELIQRLESSQVAWGCMSTVDGVLHHPALRRMAVALPNGDQIQLPRPAGRGDFEPGPVSKVGADTERVRREFDALP